MATEPPVWVSHVIFCIINYFYSVGTTPAFLRNHCLAPDNNWGWTALGQFNHCASLLYTLALQGIFMFCKWKSICFTPPHAFFLKVIPSEQFQSCVGILLGTFKNARLQRKCLGIRDNSINTFSFQYQCFSSQGGEKEKPVSSWFHLFFFDEH